MLRQRVDTSTDDDCQDWKFRSGMALRSIHESAVKTKPEWESKVDHMKLREIWQDLHSMATQTNYVLAKKTQGGSSDIVRNTEDIF